jgi:hypothetical protein
MRKPLQRDAVAVTHRVRERFAKRDDLSHEQR